MRLTNKFGIVFGTAAVAALCSCSSSSSDSESSITWPDNGSSSMGGNGFEDLSVPDQEFLYNYEMLDLFYLYAHKQNELSSNLDDYYGKGDAAGFATKFADTYYMYSEMSCPFTRYFDPSYAEYIYSLLMESEEEVGIGVSVQEEGTTLSVSRVYAKSPAEKAGLMEGDVIVSIDGAAVSSKKAFNKLTSGEKGDEVTVVVLRGEEEKTFNIALDEYLTPTVNLTYEDSIPVIQITEFTGTTVSDSGTYGEFLEALRKTEGAKSTIIDLRGNPGGDTDHCNNISAEMLSKGDTIIIDVETNVDSIVRGGQIEYIQKFDTTTYVAETDGIAKDRYYVLLADTNSASCAEVVLSAITVNKKAPVVGQVSYGKGIGQYVMETLAGGIALITGLQGIDKNGDVYHKVGILPDYPIDDPDEQMAKAVELAKEATEKRTAGYGTESTGHFAKMKAKSNIKGIPTSKKELFGGKLIFKNFKKSH